MPKVGPNMYRINPRFFANLDKKIDYANSQGFVVLLESLRRDFGQYLNAYYGAADPGLSPSERAYWPNTMRLPSNEMV